MADTQKKTARKGGYSLYNLRLTIYRFWVIKSRPASFFVGGKGSKKQRSVKSRQGKVRKRDWAIKNCSELRAVKPIKY